jgi:CheY-like chemotaxis protein
MPSTPPTPLPRILLIDDDPISREVLAMMLEAHGFPVQPAEDGQQALTALEGDAPSPERILMDTQMPGLSGSELVAALRNRCKARILAISGSDPGPAIRQACDGFLLKPIQPEQVVALLAAQPSDKSVQPGIDIDAASTEPASLIDPAILNKLRAMMPAPAVLEIYAAVAADLKTRLPLLESAMAADNPPEVKRIAHSIKGGCAMVGLTSATKTAARLEVSNTPVTWPEELTQLRFAFSALEGMLRSGLPE